MSAEFTAEEVRDTVQLLVNRIGAEPKTYVTSKEVCILADMLEQREAVADDDRTCETCEGLGTIDETLGGIHTSNPKAECPDCDGVGEYVPRQSRQAMDAAKYKRICDAFDKMKTSTSERFLECLGIYEAAVTKPFDDLFAAAPSQPEDAG